MKKPNELPIIPLDEAIERYKSAKQGLYEIGYREGAAVAFGLMGMAAAIQKNGPRVVHREYWTSELDGKRWYTCWCPGCGAYMKWREAGVDEGTLSEWCGGCRY
jgi:hypothetical protein